MDLGLLLKTAAGFAVLAVLFWAVVIGSARNEDAPYDTRQDSDDAPSNGAAA